MGDDDFGPAFGDGMDSFNTMFSAMSGLFVVVFILVVGVIVFGLVKAVSQGMKNNAAPEVTAQAMIVDKRERLSGGGTTHSAPTLSSDGSFHHTGIASSSPVHQEHYVTFEQAGGERFEMKVPASEYGLMVVGDQGTVTMKGTRFLGFQREWRP